MARRRRDREPLPITRVAQAARRSSAERAWRRAFKGVHTLDQMLSLGRSTYPEPKKRKRTR